jgi:hypothetical protein
MGVRTALSRYYGLNEPFQKRPSRLNFQGFNWESVQAQNLIVALPMWEPPGTQAMDCAPSGGFISGTPFNVLGGYDQDFGDVYIGDGTGGADPTRGYNFGYVPELNFGLGPYSFSWSCWLKTLTAAPAVDMYIMAYDQITTNFPGFAVSLDTSGSLACNTGNASFPDGGWKTARNIYDGKWHHYLFTHQVGVANGQGAVNTYYIDGALDLISGTPCSTIGAVSNTTNFYIGVDDDGLSQAFGGAFCDLRFYNGVLGLAEAQRMYHPDTRWELYSPRRKGWTVFAPPPDLDRGEWMTRTAAMAHPRIVQVGY